MDASLLRLDVVLLSGRAVGLAAHSDVVTVGELRRLAEQRLQRGIARLLHQDLPGDTRGITEGDHRGMTHGNPYKNLGDDQGEGRLVVEKFGG
eukprot:Skav212507  [mRNA]  locus=scaffold2713:92237:92515:+ [translate_table: standard]